MSVAGSIDAPLEIFGGVVTDMAPADLPQGVSPDCADVAFLQGGVKTRPGLQSVFAALGGNPTVNYLKTYITLNLTTRLLILDALGNLWKETSPAVLANVASGLAVNAYGRSATLFGREYLAISDGKFGADMPRQFDDANFDRVSQVGPAARRRPRMKAAPRQRLRHRRQARRERTASRISPHPVAPCAPRMSSPSPRPRRTALPWATAS